MSGLMTLQLSVKIKNYSMNRMPFEECFTMRSLALNATARSKCTSYFKPQLKSPLGKNFLTGHCVPKLLCKCSSILVFCMFSWVLMCYRITATPTCGSRGGRNCPSLFAGGRGASSFGEVSAGWMLERTRQLPTADTAQRLSA